MQWEKSFSGLMLPPEENKDEQPQTLGATGILIFGVVTVIVFMVVGDIFSDRKGNF